MRNRRFVLAIVAAALLIAAARHPSADIRILTHDQADRAPHRIQAAIDLGLFAFSVLITWTTKRFA
ncbi:MAG: hypothetical protein JWN66_2759 [Sphingomonas bacterium]|uniref:hypothetical protein n=1 Tax=Sphingomonas bacterium TaxID=1895847 RepID=UPI00261735FC|nr:hypothetical protein [Sphingomonas bacterium]MDB5705643.1 hypothetical protein [Sphingomonas bacterium]